ncbi:MAG TPA: AAA family ATPase [Burkholderiales bacterium]|nr:AAA family ATPase [Burkholderiales bacterium]
MPGPVSQGADLDTLNRVVEKVRTNIKRVIEGKPDVISSAITVLLAEGHLLIEDVPGVGKTMLAKSLARSIDSSVRRIQFTPDLLPSDVTGVSVYNQETRQFEFRPGGVFANIVVGDEINRASPKTQSALLECMEERQVTVDNTTYTLEAPFMVIATQNPIEMEGTYPLPEAQMDRFFFKLRLDFPGMEQLHTIIDRTTKEKEPAVRRVLEQGQILEMRDTARAIPVARPVQEYAIKVTLATHPESDQAHEMTRRYVRFGSSPRGVQALIVGAKVHALMKDRVHVSCEDVRAVALPALRHRVLLNFEAEAQRVDADAILSAILESVPEPKE